MYKSKQLIRVTLTVAALVCTSAHVYADQQYTPEQTAENNQGQATNQRHRHKMPHDARRAAADRLKSTHQAERAKALEDQVQQQGKHANRGGGI